MRFLIHFAQQHTEFRLPELDSVAKILGIDVDYDISAYHDDVSPPISILRDGTD